MNHMRNVPCTALSVSLRCARILHQTDPVAGTDVTDARATQIGDDVEEDGYARTTSEALGVLDKVVDVRETVNDSAFTAWFEVQVLWHVHGVVCCLVIFVL